MELIENLIILCIVGILVEFVMGCYAMIKIKMIEELLNNFNPEKIMQDILKTKIPVIMGPDGQPIPLTTQLPGKTKNPLTG